MKLKLGALVAFALVGLLCSAGAQPTQLFDRLYRDGTAADSENLTKPSSVQALAANCDVTTALQAAIRGDSKTFGPALSSAEDGLRATAKNLQPLSEKKMFRKPVNLPPSLIPTLNQNTGTVSTAVPTGDQVLANIARLAGESADALAEIRNGTGGQNQLELVIRNNAIITQLIFAFYTSVSA